MKRVFFTLLFGFFLFATSLAAVTSAPIKDFSDAFFFVFFGWVNGSLVLYFASEVLK
jgi:hypothetical protein